MIKKIILWTAVILTCIMIFCFSSAVGNVSKIFTEKITQESLNVIGQSNNNGETQLFKNIHKLIRKTGHILEFAILGALAFLLVKSYGLSTRLSIIIALFFSLLCGITDEIHQLFVDGRNGAVIDVFIDLCGSALGVLFINMIKSISKKRCKISDF